MKAPETGAGSQSPAPRLVHLSTLMQLAYEGSPAAETD
ncbi:hypothetical protein B0G73_11286 [Paraburkholderia sp. BL25I1N1]|nr:hypothetical protein B0G73_11286 [Paraburkholderia sp. BL25I1N1]